jgi:curved DNA-binding protein
VYRKTASDDEIKKAFRKLAVKYHPDRGGDEKKFKEANEAYDTLKNKDKRQEYDTLRKYGANMGGRGSGFRFTSGNFDEFFGGDFFDEFMSGLGGLIVALVTDRNQDRTKMCPYVSQ